MVILILDEQRFRKNWLQFKKVYWRTGKVGRWIFLSVIYILVHSCMIRWIKSSIGTHVCVCIDHIYVLFGLLVDLLFYYVNEMISTLNWSVELIMSKLW